ncbi:MAG: hypothetical protein LRY51_09675 [Geovibrio sp.]|nr:hypothetical protein [Geovibrio sp.]
MKENLGKFFTSKNMNDVTYEVEVIEPVEGVEALKFVKLTFKDAERARSSMYLPMENTSFPTLQKLLQAQGLKISLFSKTLPPQTLTSAS